MLQATLLYTWKGIFPFKKKKKSGETEAISPHALSLIFSKMGPDIQFHFNVFFFLSMVCWVNSCTAALGAPEF